MPTRIGLTLCAALWLALAACSQDAPEDAQASATAPAETAEETPAQDAAAQDEAETPVLAAVEESDGSFDAAAEAEQVTLRMAQETAARTPQRFTEGEHYQRFRPTKTTILGADAIEVAEVFWYGCNHCYNLEPTLKAWQQGLPADVTFVKMPAVWNPTLESHAQLFYTIEALAAAGEVEDSNPLHQAVFDAIHVDRNPLRGERSMTELLARFGVEKAAFDAAWGSFEVNTRMRQAKSLNRAYSISSVPTIVVNGKYVTSEVSAGGKQELIAVIEELVASER